jgi:hypothetical protein
MNSAQTALLTARAFNAFDTDIASSLSINWSSADTTLGTVAPASGVTTILTAVGPGPGTVAITAAAPANSLSTNMTLTVNGPIPSVALSVQLVPSSIALVTGGLSSLAATSWTGLNGTGTQITGRSYTYVSSNPAVATVSSVGLVTALTVGTATITATDTTDLVNGTAAVDVQVANTTHPNLPPGMNLEIATIWVIGKSFKNGPSGSTTSFGRSGNTPGSWDEAQASKRPNSTVIAPRSGFPANSGCLQYTYPTGHPGGTAPYATIYNFATPRRRFYFHSWIEYCRQGDAGVGGDFTTNGNVQIKQMWVRRDGQQTSGAFLEMKRGGGSVDSSLFYDWNLQSWGNAPAQQLGPNQGTNPEMTDGGVHELEMYFEMSPLGAGDPNGTWRMWIDGNLIANYNTLTFGGAGSTSGSTTQLGQLRFEGTYGGGTNPAPYDMLQWWGPVYLYGAD